MAAAEARAAWQRAANRCFVQEDAKRAPKLACCPSSSASSKLVDAGPANATDGPDHPTVGFMPLKRNLPGFNLPPDTRWWLQMQPNYGYQKGLTYEQENALETEGGNIQAGIVSLTPKMSGVQSQSGEENTHVDGDVNIKTSVDACDRVFAARMKKDPEVKTQELKTICSQNAQELLKIKDLKKYDELMEMDPVACSVSKQPSELCFDLESPWIGAQKNEPWWRTADRDELASLVARKSLDYFENCDLPQPQNTRVQRDPFAHLGYVDHNGIITSSLDWKAQTCGLSRSTVQAQGTPASGSPYGRQWVSVEEANSKCGSDKTFSSSGGQKDTTESRQISESDPAKAQLLEALRHSQTRAREAEKAAKQAQAEKEHIIRLFFRQASQLFAYKQWFQLLQLETFYFQIKNKDQPISTFFPVVLPWMPFKARKMRKSSQKAARGKRGKRGRPKYDISKYALALALGLSLVSAGLLLGWTVGWMLPTF